MAELRKYGVSTTLNFPLFAAGTNDFKTDAAHASGDTIISKDEGAEANTTNGFVDEGRSYSLALTATEMEAARIVITIIDQGTKAYDDQCVIIETYGHASAQHPFDLGTASTPQTGDNYARLGAPAGASLSADVAAVKSETATILSDTNDIQTRIPAALVSGRMDASVGAMAANVITAAATDADFGTEIGAAVWNNGTRVLTAGTNIALAKGTGVTGFNDLDAAGVRSAVGLASANLDTQLTAIDDFLDTEIAAIKAKTDNLPASPAATGDIPSAATIAGAVWDEAYAGHLTSGTFGKLIVDAETDAGLIKVVTDKLDSTLELDSTVYRFTANALEQAPSGGGGGLDAAGVRAAIGLASANLDTQLGAIDTVVDAILVDTAEIGAAGAGLTALASAANLSTLASYVDTEVAAIKAKTDNLPASPAATGDIPAADITAIKAKTDQLVFTSGSVNANIEYVNGIEVAGTGAIGDEWGPA